MSPENCPFCQRGARVVAENELAAALLDREPASRGHTLVVPKRHCTSFFDLTDAEVAACYALLRAEHDETAGGASIPTASTSASTTARLRASRSSTCTGI